MGWLSMWKRRPAWALAGSSPRRRRQRLTGRVLAHWNPGYVPGYVLLGHYGSSRRWPSRGSGPRDRAPLQRSPAETSGPEEPQEPRVPRHDYRAVRQPRYPV
jgi:hypothetical protein